MEKRNVPESGVGLIIFLLSNWYICYTQVIGSANPNRLGNWTNCRRVMSHVESTGIIAGRK